MKEKIIHQWRDWVLEYVSDGKYELIQKDTQSVRSIMARTAMDAENQCQQIIKNAKGGVPQAPEVANSDKP